MVLPHLKFLVYDGMFHWLQVDNAHKEIEDCRNHLSACLEANEKMTRWL